jgi:hypothetical protein
MKILNQNGFGAVEIFISIVVLGAVGGAGYFVWSKNKNTNKQATNNMQTPSPTVTVSTSPTPTPQADPTESWQSYTNAYGKFTVKFPTSWHRQTENLEYCTEGLVMLGSTKDHLGKCASDSGGQVAIGVTEVTTDEYQAGVLTSSYYDNLVSTSATINGVTGMRYSGTYKEDAVDGGIGPEAGTVTVSYKFVKNNRSYYAMYSERAGHETDVTIFDQIIKLGWTF